ncbi:HlyD family secretion protein [Pseudooceanicola nanhaiensis]|uniref:HlyD family secretion protein n=1 Tax=Pseudooceanicola nanhaiensis TaxID=375761 RepID=UPI001CD57761|nr:HlyD family efflux transporter periplasmic adaptor subunit [Pseudooceanicola nanhaiensis]MCA0921954.1 HlyD family efflux transporter periplasmic adaptor subunit [Pseudooceanicola nanhaiensis]
MKHTRRNLLWGAAVVAAALVVLFILRSVNADKLPEGIATGNGRIQATEVDISALAAGRIRDIFPAEGDYVEKDAPLVQMDTDQLEAQKHQAEAALRRTKVGVETAKTNVEQAEAQVRAAVASVAQAEATKTAADSRLARSRRLALSDTVSQQTLEDNIASAHQAEAAVAAAEAQQAAAEAGVSAAQAAVIDAEAAVEAQQAALDAINVSLKDATLTSPIDGRVQYLVARPGEIVAAGGRVLNLVDLNDVYMTFFLPTEQAGRLEIGDEARIVLDAAPLVAIPATISFVADVAQFTPRSVETQDERTKLMFRVRAQIDRALLAQYTAYVKTGLPGVVYVRTAPGVDWPEVATTRVELPEPRAAGQ